MTSRTVRESHPHQTKACAALLIPFALGRAEGIVSIHVRHVGSHFSQANNKRLDLLRQKRRQQPFFAGKRRNNNAVVKCIAGLRQPHNPRAVVLGIGLAGNESFLFEHVQAPADRALIKSDRIDDLVSADVGHSREHAHYAPLGDAKAKMLSVGVGCAARQPVRNIREKVWDVAVEIERNPVGRCCCAFLTNDFLAHQNAPQFLDKIGHSQKTEKTR